MTKPRSPKIDCLECRFHGVIRVPISVFTSEGLDAANKRLEAIVSQISKVALDGSTYEITFVAAKPGKMDAPKPAPAVGEIPPEMDRRA